MRINSSQWQFSTDKSNIEIFWIGDKISHETNTVLKNSDMFPSAKLRDFKAVKLKIFGTHNDTNSTFFYKILLENRLKSTFKSKSFKIAQNRLKNKQYDV